MYFKCSYYAYNDKLFNIQITNILFLTRVVENGRFSQCRYYLCVAVLFVVFRMSTTAG